MELSLADFLKLNESERIAHIKQYSVLYAQQFDRDDLDYLCRLSDACRTIHKLRAGSEFLQGLLPHRMALNFFVQPSSRTFLSFNAAQAMLGMRRMSVRDMKISSMSKGETLADSIRTFISYVDLIVMRHSDDEAAAVAFWTSMKSHRRVRFADEQRPVPIVSGGSGSKQHPTQALLDIYTLQKSLEKVGGIDGKNLMLVGDLKRGRTVRSLSYLMKNFRDMTLTFAAPEQYQMLDDILDFLKRHGIRYRMVGSISEAIREVDAVYMTRIQDELDNLAPGTHVRANKEFVFTVEHLKQMQPHACLMHPLPKRDEIEAGVDFVDDPRVVYWRQERNGMWMRTAIIAQLFKVDGEILQYHAAHHG